MSSSASSELHVSPSLGGENKSTSIEIVFMFSSSCAHNFAAVVSSLTIVDIISVVDEQNRHTQVQRMSSLSSIKRENSDELKDAEPRKCWFEFSRGNVGTLWKGKYEK